MARQLRGWAAKESKKEKDWMVQQLYINKNWYTKYIIYNIYK